MSRDAMTERAEPLTISGLIGSLKSRSGIVNDEWLTSAIATVESLQRENERLKAVLKPFAKAGSLMDLVRRADDDVVYTPVIDANYCITAGDLREARAALTEPTQSGEGKPEALQAKQATLEDAIFQVIYDEDFESGFLSREWAQKIAKKVVALAKFTPPSSQGWRTPPKDSL